MKLLQQRLRSNIERRSRVHNGRILITLIGVYAIVAAFKDSLHASGKRGGGAFCYGSYRYYLKARTNIILGLVTLLLAEAHDDIISRLVPILF